MTTLATVYRAVANFFLSPEFWTELQRRLLLLLKRQCMISRLKLVCQKKLDLCNCFDMILACDRHRLMANIMLS